LKLEKVHNKLVNKNIDNLPTPTTKIMKRFTKEQMLDIGMDFY